MALDEVAPRPVLLQSIDSQSIIGERSTPVERRTAGVTVPQQTQVDRVGAGVSDVLGDEGLAVRLGQTN